MTALRLENLERLPETTGGLSFIDDLEKYQSEKPYRWTGALDKTQEHLRTNISLNSRDDIQFRDIRSLIDSEQGLSVRDNGFQILRYPSMDDSKMGEESGLKSYAAGLTELVKKATSAELVYCVNFMFRQCTRAMMMDPDVVNRQESPIGSAKEPELPAFITHADYSNAQGADVVRKTLTEAELSRFTNDHHTIWLLNTWSPLYKPVKNAPLAFCHPRTVSADDVIEIDKARPDRVTGVRYLKYRPGYQWYWCSNQTPDEISLFKSWTSNPDDPLQFVPHGAVRFVVDNAAADGNLDDVLRDSMETRMVVVMKRDGNGN